MYYYYFAERVTRISSETDSSAAVHMIDHAKL